MRALVGDTWIPGLLDPCREAGEILVDVSAWVALRPVDGLYFSADRDWRRVLRYVREFGLRRVLDKIRSRRAESGRNEKFLCVGEGIVREADEGSPLRVGDAVRFVAPAHPRSVDRACLPIALVRPASVGAGGCAAESPAWDSLAGWSPCSGNPLDPSLVDAVLDSARGLLASAPRNEMTSAASSPITRRSQSRRATRPGALRAAVFGLGHYAKTNLIPNLPEGIEVTEIREIDPLQVGPTDEATRHWSVSTDPHLAADAPFDVVCAAGFHHTHAPLALSALRSGAWAIVEKPIATTRPQLDALIETVAAHPGRLFACFHKRFDPLNAWARADLGVMPGEAIHYQAIVFEVPLPARHWYRWPASGSRIVSNGCHWIDHFLFLNDWSCPVRSSASRASNGDITCLAELENGASLTLVLTDHGSARLGVRDHVELRARDTTVVIEDGSAYRAERTSGLIRRATLSRRETYSRMYRSIGARILSSGGGDSLESIERSAGLVLDLEESL